MNKNMNLRTQLWLSMTLKSYDLDHFRVTSVFSVKFFILKIYESKISRNQLFLVNVIPKT